MQLWKKILLGLVLGILAGIVLPIEYIAYAKPIGDIFLRLIKMVIIPLIFFSLISGIITIPDSKTVGRVGIKSLIAFFITTFFAVIFGLLMAYLLKPGVGVNINFGNSPKIDNIQFDLVSFFVNIIPNNIFVAFVENNLLQVVFVSILIGYTINVLGKQVETIRNLVIDTSQIILKMISFIIELSPYAVFAITACMIKSQGLDVLQSLSKLIFAIVVAMILQYFIFGILIYLFGRLSPWPFYRKSIEYQAMAFSTSSSKATLPTTMKICREKLGISESSTSFILPLGSTINMDGFAIKLSLTAIFVAQLTGISLSMHDYFIIVITATLGSIGGAGIPGAYLIMLPMVLSSVNLPIEGVAILAGIDRILDMLSTTINITGDVTVTLIVDNSEGTLDKKVYYS